MRKPRTPLSEAAPKPPGAFTATGSWNERADFSDRRHMHSLIAALVSERRRGKLTPELAANAIVAGNAHGAFPNYLAWWKATDWALVPTGTSAEECVKRAGRGILGHWCGQEWSGTPRSECQDPRHREKAAAEQIAVMVAGIGAQGAQEGTQDAAGGDNAPVEASGVL